MERLVNPDLSQGRPAFGPVIRASSGLMMVQITAASLVAESRPWPCGEYRVHPTDANRRICPHGYGGG